MPAKKPAAKKPAAKKPAESSKPAEFDVGGLVESAFLIGLGALEITREKLTELGDDMVERGKMSKTDAKKFTDRIGKVAKEQEKAVSTVVRKEMDRALKSTGMATKKDTDALRAEIADLKAQLASAGIAKPAPKPAARKAAPKKKAPAKKPSAAKASS
jgi:polyhydroxyalkanoate synthesis regulator phasin